MPFGNFIGYGVESSGTIIVPSGFNFRKDIGAGFAQTVLLTAKAEQCAGVGVTQYPAKLMTNEVAGVGVSTFSSGTIKPAQGAGVGVGPVLAMINKPESKPGIAMTRISYTYVGTKWVGTATSIGADAWTNLTNAQGAANGASATRAGQVLSTTSAELRGQFQSIGLKESLNLSKVELRFYVAQAGTLLNNGGLALDYRKGSSGAWTNLITYTDNQNFISSPRVFDMTAIAPTWADAKALEVRVAVTLGIATSGVTCSVDAVDLHLEASLIDTL